MKFRILVVLAFALVSVMGMAQAPDLAPPPELKKLDWYIGEWSGKVKWSMMGMPPTEEETSFKNEWEGQFLKSTSIMTMSGMKMTEVGFIGWNPKTKLYDAYIFTNFAPMPRIEHGEADATRFIFTSEPWAVGGMEIVGRATMNKKSADELGFVLEFKMGEKWEKVGEGTFKKKK